MTELEIAKQNLADAFRELRDAELMPENNEQQRLHKITRIASKAENVAHAAQLVRLHMRQTPDGCILD